MTGLNNVINTSVSSPANKSKNMDTATNNDTDLKAEAEIQALSQKISDSESEKLKLTQQIQDLQKKNKELEDNANYAEEQYLLLESELQGQPELLKEKIKEVQSLKFDYINIQKENSSLCEERKEFQKTVAALEKDLLKAQSKRQSSEELAPLVEDYQNEDYCRIEELNKVKAERDDAQIELRGLEGDLQTKESELQRAQEEAGSWRLQYLDICNEFDNLARPISRTGSVASVVSSVGSNPTLRDDDNNQTSITQSFNSQATDQPSSRQIDSPAPAPIFNGQDPLHIARRRRRGVHRSVSLHDELNGFEDDSDVESIPAGQDNSARPSPRPDDKPLPASPRPEEIPLPASPNILRVSGIKSVATNPLRPKEEYISLWKRPWTSRISWYDFIMTVVVQVLIVINVAILIDHARAFSYYRVNAWSPEDGLIYTSATTLHVFWQIVCAFFDWVITLFMDPIRAQMPFNYAQPLQYPG